MTAIPTPEEMVRRVKAAYAEAGWPEVEVHAGGTSTDGWPRIRISITGPEPPDAVTWQVGWVVSDGKTECWSCWCDPKWGTVAADCRAGRCHHPEGPARPPREELVRR